MAAALYALGSNGSGQLGIGHKEDVSVPKPVLFDGEPLAPGPVVIRAGGNHTLLLSASGQLYCAGDFSTGACGFDSREKPHLLGFRKLNLSRQDTAPEAPSKVIYCAATWEASIVVTCGDDGRATQVYAFGTGIKGELGLGEMIFKTSTAQLIKDFPPPGTEVVDLTACVTHVVAVLNNGDAYGWGNGRKGQLGEPAEVVYSPRKITGTDFSVARAVCGREFTYMLGKPETGDHLLFGIDKWGINSFVSEDRWRDVGASWGTLFLLKEGGRLDSCGRDDHGQMAPLNLPHISDVAVGSEHVMALDAEGNALAWGWGEHGNCGPTTSSTGDVRGKWNVVASPQYLPAGSKIISIGAGCATSWICIGVS